MADENDQDRDQDQDREDKQDATTPGKDRPRQATTAVAAQPDDDEDIEALRAKLARAQEDSRRKDSDLKKLRQLKEDVERKQREAEDAQLSEAERTKRERDEATKKADQAVKDAADLRTKLIDKEREIAVEREARRQGWQHPELAWNNVERDRVEVEVDPDTGKVKVSGAKEAVERFSEKYPGIAGGSSGHRGGTPPRELASQRRSPAGTRQDGPSIEERLLEGNKYFKF